MSEQCPRCNSPADHRSKYGGKNRRSRCPEREGGEVNLESAAVHRWARSLPWWLYLLVHPWLPTYPERP